MLSNSLICPNSKPVFARLYEEGAVFHIERMASSLLSSLDMSLDDLIASKKKKSPQNPDARPDKIERRGGRQGSIGPIRKGRRDRVRRTNQPYARHVSHQPLRVTSSNDVQKSMKLEAEPSFVFLFTTTSNG